MMGPTMLVYFIQRGKRGPIKIGATARNPAARLADLQTASPEKLRLLGCVRSSERYLHELFREHHIAGEWFRPHKRVLSFVAKNAIVLPPADKRDGRLTVRISDELKASIEEERRQASARMGTHVTQTDLIVAALKGYVKSSGKTGKRRGAPRVVSP